LVSLKTIKSNHKSAANQHFLYYSALQNVRGPKERTAIPCWSSCLLSKHNLVKIKTSERLRVY